MPPFHEVRREDDAVAIQVSGGLSLCDNEHAMRRLLTKSLEHRRGMFRTQQPLPAELLLP